MILRAHWPDGLAEWVSSRFSQRWTAPKSQVERNRGSDLILASDLHTWVHICVQVCVRAVYTHVHTQWNSVTFLTVKLTVTLGDTESCFEDRGLEVSLSFVVLFVCYSVLLFSKGGHLHCALCILSELHTCTNSHWEKVTWHIAKHK